MEWQNVGLQMWEPFQVKFQIGPKHKVQGGAKERGRFRLVGGRFNKKENLAPGLVLGIHKKSKSPHLPIRNL